MSNVNFKKILWAVDVFTDIESLEQIAAGNIKLLLKKLNIEAKVDPICVFPGIGDDFPYVEEEIQKRLDKVQVPGLQSLKVIPEHLLYPPSVADQAKTLIRYSQENGYDLIVATTHAHNAFNQFLLGSFTEIIVHSSKIPLYIVNPRTEVRKEFKNILLPVNYYGYNDAQLLKSVDLAKQMSSHLMFYHHIRDYSLKYIGLQKGMFDILKGRQQKIMDKANAEQKSIKMRLQLEAADVEFITQTNALSTKESIVQCQKDMNVDLVMIPQSYDERELPFLISGISTFVIQHVNCPVMVIK